MKKIKITIFSKYSNNTYSCYSLRLMNTHTSGIQLEYVSIIKEYGNEKDKTEAIYDGRVIICNLDDMYIVKNIEYE